MRLQRIHKTRNYSGNIFASTKKGMVGRLFQQNIVAAMRAFEEQEFDQGRFYMHYPKK